jgi:hypothetical protein
MKLLACQPILDRTGTPASNALRTESKRPVARQPSETMLQFVGIRWPLQEVIQKMNWELGVLGCESESWVAARGCKSCGISTQQCHSERSEESLFDLSAGKKRGGILRFAGMTTF